MSIDAMMMVARIEQEYRMEQAAKLNLLFEAESNRRRTRGSLFTRRMRVAK